MQRVASLRRWTRFLESENLSKAAVTSAFDSAIARTAWVDRTLACVFAVIALRRLLLLSRNGSMILCFNLVNDKKQGGQSKKEAEVD